MSRHLERRLQQLHVHGERRRLYSAGLPDLRRSDRRAMSDSQYCKYTLDAICGNADATGVCALCRKSATRSTRLSCVATV